MDEHEQIASHYKILEHENLLLREYVIQLQSRLIANGDSDMPAPPFDLSRPSARIAAAAAAAAAAVERDTHVTNVDDDDDMELQLQAAAAAADGGDSEEDVTTANLTAELHAAAEAAMESARVIGNAEGGDKSATR